MLTPRREEREERRKSITTASWCFQDLQDPQDLQDLQDPQDNLVLPANLARAGCAVRIVSAYPAQVRVLEMYLSRCAQQVALQGVAEEVGCAVWVMPA
jgi:hypothetical protein